MGGFFDIVPSTETCEVGGAKFKVKGIPINMLFMLCRQDEAFVAAMVEKQAVPQNELMVVCFANLVTIIGEGVMAEFDPKKDGDADDFRERAEKYAASLSADIQMKIFAKIWKATMPEGPGPLFEELKAAFEGAPSESHSTS